MLNLSCWSNIILLFLILSILPHLNQTNSHHHIFPSKDEGTTIERRFFEFTQSVYNASVPENSLGSTLVIPIEKMGVWNEYGIVRMEIIDGDRLKLFRLEEIQVGIFCFLIIRVNNNERSLNREFKDLYKLRIRATLYEIRNSTPHSIYPNSLPQVKSSMSNLNLPSETSINLIDIGMTDSTEGQGLSTKSLNGKVIRQVKLNENYQIEKKSIDFHQTYSIKNQNITTKTLLTKFPLANLELKQTNKETEKNSHDLQSLSTLSSHTILNKTQNINPEASNEKQPRGKKDTFSIPSLKLKSSFNRTKSNGRRPLLRRNLRDDRRNKIKNKTKSFTGEKRKNRKDKQFLSSPSPSSILGESNYNSNVPSSTTSTTTIKTTTIPTISTSPITTPNPIITKSKIGSDVIPKDIKKVEDIKLIPIAIAECTVFIQILDQPDNGPLFEQRTYDISVLEDIAVLSKIAKITAVDADIGKNQEIYYSLAEWNSHFGVDPILGIISPTRPLIGMVGKRQHIRIQARNRWSPGPAAESISIVSIRPANRYTPQILINRPPQVEPRPHGVIYAIVSCRDNDEGPSGYVDVTIKDGDPNGIFHILPAPSRNEFYVVMSPIVASSLYFKAVQSSSARLSTASSTANTFNLTLRAEDRGQPPRTSEKELQLKVLEGSDGGYGNIISGNGFSSYWNNGRSHSQTLFDKDLYEVEISESSPPHTIVFRVLRPDPKVTLSISSGNEGEEFKLEKSGVLYTMKWLDFERKSIFTLTVDSLDLRPLTRFEQSRRHRSAVKIIIKLIDENKFWPVFDPPGNTSEVYFPENEPIGTLVTKIHAKDLDQGENGYVTYSIANVRSLPFTIDHFTGEVRSTEVLDYETSRRLFRARLRATDWGQPYRRESEMKLRISLLPVNDNRPLFIYSNCLGLIDKRIHFETEFGRVLALDFDHDSVTYKIVHGNSDSCFSIDGTGTLRVMCDLRDFRNTKRILNITASDGEFYSDIMPIKIELRESLRTTNFNKSESSPSRQGIKLYSTSHSVFECQDTGVQERYDRMAALAEENNKLDEMDVDEENQFPALPSHYTENTQPQFLDFPNEIRVNESIEVGTRVFKLKAIDRDKGYNAFLKFVISSGDENHGAWDIVMVETSSWTGVTVQEAFLVLARPLDREEFSSYTLNISVFDQGKPPRSMSKLLPIKVLDVNDNAPEFIKPAMKIRIKEGNDLVGETIAEVRAVDEDEEGTLNSLITYKILNESHHHNFSIDSKTGKIRLLGELDRELEDHYSLLILAEDNGTPKQSSTALLTIIVEDQNDESPRFLNFGDENRTNRNSGGSSSSSSRIIKVREDWPLYSVITRVVAEDPDLDEGGLIRYSILDGTKGGDFILDDVSGVLRINRKLDYQRTSMYNLTIQARDLGTPAHSSQTYLIIEIFDVAESEPYLWFPDLVTIGKIREGSPVGSIVSQVNVLSNPPISYPGVYYSLDGSSQFLFSIDGSGTVRTLYELDYETQPHWYYLTLTASSLLDMSNSAYTFLVIELENENDCVPLTTQPLYLIQVEENQDPGIQVLHLTGFDCDNPSENLRYNFRSLNSYFEIDSITGILSTITSLDREEQSEQILDIIISDSHPKHPLNSTTKIIITVGDANDHIPRLLQFSSGSIYDIPELKPPEIRGVQSDDVGMTRRDIIDDEDFNLSIPENEESEFDLKWSDWRVMAIGEEEMVMTEGGWRKIFRVVGYDPDGGLNGTLYYRLKYRVSTLSTTTDLHHSEDEIYSIHPSTGEIYTSATSLKSETVLKFIIEVTDNNGESWGSRSESDLTLRVKSVEKAKGSLAPQFLYNPLQQITLTTQENPGYTVETFEVNDPDGDTLWYEIVSGDPDQHFIMFPDSQNLILARTIASPRNFRLNISVSDGFNFVFTQLLIRVISSHEESSTLIWEHQNYSVEISESTPPFSVVTMVRLNISSRPDSSSLVPLYGFHNTQDPRSLRLFSIDSVTGVVRTMMSGNGERIDREVIPVHILTVKARTLEMTTFIRLRIRILDENDKAPVFGTYSQREVRIPETLAIGSLVTQVFAYDEDMGENGILKYAITYGNIGNTFEIDNGSGRIFLRRQLTIPLGQSQIEYQLTIKATDNGSPSLSATTSLTVIVSLPSDSQLLSLSCTNDEDEAWNHSNLLTSSHPLYSNSSCTCTIHIHENSPPGTYVTTLHVLNSPAGVHFEIDETRNQFWLDPATGILLVGRNGILDREIKSVYDFSIKATNAQGVSASCKIFVVLEDENDCVPMFTNQLIYEGYISEDAPLGTLVLESLSSRDKDGLLDSTPQHQRNPLVFRSIDYDTGRNAIVSYSFVEDEEMRTIFYMDPSSGALLLVTSLDYEKRQFYNFHVRVCDFQYCDASLANVTVRVLNVNDQEPIVFSAEVEFLLPTASGVLVHVLEAFDPDGDELQFTLLNYEEVYDIESRTGRVVVKNPERVILGKQAIEINVSDGRFTKTASLTLTIKHLEIGTDFGFSNQTFEATFPENSTKISNLVALPVTGTHLNENLQFTILNPTIYFGIMKTSGVIVTTGNKLDREHQSQHNLLVQVRGDDEKRISRCFLKIRVTDVNDNAPYFLNLPYIGVVVVNSVVGEHVLQVKAEDLDIGENGIIRYELVRGPFGDLYDLNKQTGEITLRRRAETVGHHELVIKAYDLGLPSLQTEIQVQIKVVSHDQPVFEHQFYETWIPESVPLYSAALGLTATSKHPIFFSIEGGNELDSFGIDYQTGILTVTAPLDYETTPIHLLKIRATDLITSTWSSTMVQMNLKDSNDEIPKPDKSTFSFHVVEGFVPGLGILGKITTKDKDEGVNALLTYEIESTDGWKRRRLRFPRTSSLVGIQSINRDEDDSDIMLNEDATTNNRSVDVSELFFVRPNDGTIILKQSLDYEYAHEYHFSVIVRDSGNPSLSATARVVINIVNINDNAPYFSKPLYIVRLSEDCVKGHVVARVVAMDLDSLDPLRYAIVGDYHKQSVFEIERTTGIVTLLQPRILQTELSFQLNISATDGVFTTYTRLQITIQPKNHFVPAFDLSIYEVLAPENAPDGFLITTLTAKDSDRSIFGEIRYTFTDVDEPNLFGIDERTGQVRLMSVPDLSLDRDYKESHTLQVAAQDGGKWIGYTKLVVKVEKRKSSPTFPVTDYRVTVPSERLRTKSPILQVVAVDSDSEFGIRYSIVDLEDISYSKSNGTGLRRDSSYFDINPDNGDLRFRLTGDDLETLLPITSRLIFQFWVRAEDGELSSSVPVTVVILPESEPSPEIHPQNATFFLKEDAAVGSIVTTFRVSNIDTPTFRVVSSNEDLFQVDPNGNLFLSGLLDQDEDKHTVVVWAQSSDQGNVATSQVTIRVLVTFSNKPKFNQPEYHLSLAEDFPEGSLVFTARAVDSEKGDNIKERYELQSEHPDIDLFHFGINQEHGWITLLNSLDYEKHRQHVLRVVASDSDNPTVTSTTLVVVNVLNVDDEPSLFDSQVYYVEVKEDVAENVVIKTLKTVDLDDINGNSTFTPKYLDFVIFNGDEESHFKINELGEISVWRKLDAEVRDRYELTVLTSDGRNLDFTNVTIKVIDVNDNVPVCPVPEMFQDLYESLPNATYVAVVEAYDPDKDSRSPLFGLSGSGAEHFRIDPESGVISVAGNFLDREVRPSYDLIVHARDREESRSECRVRIRISLLDENDNAPIWKHTAGTGRGDEDGAYYKFSLKEDSPIGTFVGKVSALDLDLGVNGRLTYALVSSLTKSGELAKDQFAVEKKSGVISLLRLLDRELIASYNLTIRATDAGSPPLSSTVNVIVQVLDINDHPPEFIVSSYSVSVSELAELSTEVVTVRATSKDEGINAEITYDIIGGNGYFHWGIDSKSGVISSNASLDFERIREYVLTVRARDGPPENQLASQCTVNISIIDENDNSPQFAQESYSVSISEDLAVSSSVVQVAATDLDMGTNAELIFSFGYGDAMHSFRIHSTTGIIHVASALDREMIPYYTIEVIATDRGIPPRLSSCLVEIQILDVNDSPPLFSKENYTAIVQEDRLIGFSIATFEVSDADSPPNSTPFSWDLKATEDEEKGVPLPFTVTDSGSLVVAGKLNSGRKNIYKLQVTVFDNGTPPLESKANVTIQVVDKSQWPPVISSLSVTAITLGDTYPPGILGICHASDFDSYDILNYSLLTTKASSFFTIDHLNGTLYSLIPLREGTYELGVVVSDGRWSARNDAYVRVISLATPFPDVSPEDLGGDSIITTNGLQSKAASIGTKEMINFVLLSISGHNQQSLLNRMSAFKNVIREAVSVDSSTKNVHEVIILSIQAQQTDGLFEKDKRHRNKRDTLTEIVPTVDVLLSVMRTLDGKFLTAEELIQHLRFALPQIEGILSAKITRITSDVCKRDTCDRGSCRTIAIFSGTQSLITTETLSLITPNHILETICTCPVGYGGLRCEKIINACAHSECAVGLICVPDDSSQGYACLCTKVNCSKGRNCEDQCAQQSVSFSGTSLLSYNVGKLLERELTISLRIKTLYTSGTLLYTTGDFDYAVLEINQGLVQFSWDLGSGKEVLTVTSISVSDNQWHRILLQLRDSYAVLRVNERSTQRQKSQGPARILHTNGIFHIGSRLIGPQVTPIDLQIPSQGFVGCMKDLRFGFASDQNNLNETVISDIFQSQTQEVKHYINAPSVGRNRVSVPDTHEHHGQYEKETGRLGNVTNSDEDSSSFAESFRMNPLPLHLKHLESSEFTLLFSRNISFTCAKVIHFVEACRSLPCKNGGTCRADSTPNGYTCDCAQPRFHGLNCEIDLEPCGSSPCLNNGKCRPTANEISFSPSLSGNEYSEAQFYCQCVGDGTYGSRCQSGKYCKNSADNLGDSEVCNHRGECEEGPDGPICWCESGYTGPRCQFDYDECKEGGERICGPGSKCVNFLGGFRCLCPSNATGVFCQKVLTTPSIVANDYQIIILIIIIVLSFILLLIIFVFARRCCIKRSRNSPSNSIPLTTSQVKVQDNRIGRDNREQSIRNRDSKISNLEVRPVSASSENFQPERVPQDAAKSYTTSGEDIESPHQFINNLMKPTPGDKKRSGPTLWETNRDDYPKIQNYIKGEISWGSKGNKPHSPDSPDTSIGGYHVDGFYSDPHGHPANISPIRILPPPPDIPDCLSLGSHDSNGDLHPFPMTSRLPPVSNSQCRDEFMEEAGDGGLEGATASTALLEDNKKWGVLHPDNYRLPMSGYGIDDNDDVSNEAIVLRNRYQEKLGMSNINKKDSPLRTPMSDDEINENCSLLCRTPFPAQGHQSIDKVASDPKSSPSGTSPGIMSPKKRFSSSSIFPMKANSSSSGRSRQPNYSKTTHVTEV